MKSSLLTEQYTRRVGLLGGTFDPIHWGHLRLARAAYDQAGLERVLFIPNNAPPHKESAGATAEQRAAMVALALAEQPGFALNRVELERPGRSYMVDTVAQLQEELGPETELLLILGADAILDIDTWYQAERLRDMISFLAAARPGFDLAALENMAPAWRRRISVIAMEETDISATEIRRRVCRRLPVSGLLPPAVEGYIIENGLYRKDMVY